MKRTAVEWIDPRSEWWYPQRACNGVNPAVFYPIAEPNCAPKFTDAIGVCAGCPVAAPCLDWWMRLHTTSAGDEYGYVGGTSPVERRKIRRQRAGELREAS